MENKEQVNHPEHYNISGRKECIEEMIEIWGPQAVATWCRITAHKYLYRAKHKGSEEVDLQKANWYIDKAESIESDIATKGMLRCLGL